MAISEGDRHDAYLPRSQPVLGMRSLVAMLRRRASFIAAVTLACFGLCLIWILLSPPRYIASGRILLDISETASAAEVGDSNSVGIENELYVMTSRSVFDRVIAQEKLDGDPLFGGKSGGLLSALVSSVGLARNSDSHALALRQLERSVNVRRNAGSTVVDVTAVTPDREMSVRIANAVMDGYLAEQAVGRGNTPSESAAPSGSRLETLQSRLKASEQRYEAFRAQNLKPDGESEKQVAELSAQANAAEAKAGALRSQLAQLQRAGRTLDGGGIPDMARRGAFGVAGYRYADARQLERDLSETLGPRHPDLVFARRRAAEAGRALEQTIGSRTRAVTADLEQARSTASGLKGRMDKVKKNLAVSAETASRLKELANDVEASRAAYQAVLARSFDASNQQRADGPNARILSRATMPLAPSGPFPAGILLMSLLLGLGLGVSLALLLELIAAEKGSVSVP